MKKCLKINAYSFPYSTYERLLPPMQPTLRACQVQYMSIFCSHKTLGTISKFKLNLEILLRKVDFLNPFVESFSQTSSTGKLIVIKVVIG